ncbi:MAG: ATP-grasp domain-containing protein [Flaviflexus sp.]|nr:ATP-grasp domain-containing protein [Flaviflexus sp.]
MAHSRRHRPHSSKRPFVPILLGSDLSIYSLAQHIHRAWGMTSYTLSELPRGPVNNSAIVAPVFLGELAEADVDSAYISAINRIAEKHSPTPALVIPNTDGFVVLLDKAREAGRLAGNVVPVIGPAPQIYEATNKAALARALTRLGLPTVNEVEVPTGGPEQWDDLLGRVSYPAVIKSADGGTTFASLSFPGKEKVYFAPDRARAREIMEIVAAGGYTGSMLVQELIEGDDTHSWVVSGYLDQAGTLTMAASAQVIMNLHHASLMGNAAALYVRRNDELIDEATALARELGLTGPFTVDVKIAPDGGHYYLDVNARVGRSCHFIYAGGINPVEIIAADLVEGRQLPERRANDEAIYTIVPTWLIPRYLTDPELKSRAWRAIRTRRVFHPLAYGRDLHPYRLAYRRINALNTARRMLRDYPRQTPTSF